MEELEDLKLIADKKRIECAIDAKAYSICLANLIPANIILVVGGALLSLVAGASLLTEQEIINKKTAGVLALVSSGFTIIHTKLNCDQYQAECKRLKSLYEGLSEDYANLEMESTVEDFRLKLKALNNERTQVKKGAGADPSVKSIDEANKLFNA
ncbi:MAG: hypothetical protein HC840_12780 [Leptolyngbyaceae cyanobacterium RM2_2_4]|nr:hypothetical protein [Leptolyngbyaceae cyanobacterium SM1_4_3]NJO50159.1 hypothetical protein [Leptolyngbyaceae cyanobacterium RM2_2_4]